MADQIHSAMGDDVQNAVVGKDNRQHVGDDRRSAATFNNFYEPRRQAPPTVEERLARLEEIIDRDVRRALALVEGDPQYRLIGIVDQLPAYIKANEDWKEATEQRIINLEAGNQIVISPRTALLFAVGAIVLLFAVYLAVAWVQGVA